MNTVPEWSPSRLAHGDASRALASLGRSANASSSASVRRAERPALTQSWYDRAPGTPAKGRQGGNDAGAEVLRGTRRRALWGPARWTIAAGSGASAGNGEKKDDAGSSAAALAFANAGRRSSGGLSRARASSSAPAAVVSSAGSSSLRRSSFRFDHSRASFRRSAMTSSSLLGCRASPFSNPGYRSDLNSPG